MNTIYHRADTRGSANHGWLNSHHTFSFANYYDRERMGFGVLRVLNDDMVLGGYGFGEHAHRNMEIVSIVLAGKLAHSDNMGNQGIINTGEIQVMSAGTGITHSEMNADAQMPVQFLQIWVIPNQMGVTPRYQQRVLQDIMQPNTFNQVVSPNPDDAGAWIYQQAWFSLGDFERGVIQTYELNDPDNGVYIFVIQGAVSMSDNILHTRDGLGVWDTKTITIKAIEDAQVLLMEVPLTR